MCAVCAVCAMCEKMRGGEFFKIHRYIVASTAHTRTPHTHAHTRALTCCVTVCGVCATQIYKEGGFFKPHVDTPQHLQSIVAMLVLCLPSAFEGVCVCVVCVSVCVCMCVRVVFNLCAICYFSRLCSAAHVCESVHQQRTCVSAACACAS